MICSWCWFIHPATAISTNRNGSRTLGIVSSLSRDLRTAVTLFLADPVFGPYGTETLVPEPVRAVGKDPAGWACQIINAFFPTIKQNRLFMFWVSQACSSDEP